ncbi:MAG TPA: cell division protein FtsA [Gemmatimonadales bacterium]|nr:cell division protein FtsA [Gemmatimonadales bacterium]
MSAQVQRLVAAVDLGSSRVVAIIGEVTGDAHSWGLRILGIASEPSNGLRRGVIRDFDEVVRAVRKAVTDAERMAGIEVGTVDVGVAGELVAHRISHGTASIQGSEVRTADLARVIDIASDVSFGHDQELLHAIAHDYRVDAQPGFADPIGMAGDSLSAEVYLVTARSSALSHIRRAVEKAGWHVGEFVLEPLAASLSVLTPDEREAGAVLLEFGAGSTSMSIFQGGRLRHVVALRFAGGHVTSDLVHGLQVPQADAERLKVEFGSAYEPMVPENEVVELAPVGGQGTRHAPRRLIAHIMHMRLQEVAELAYDEVARAGYTMGALPGGVILSGAGAAAPGMVELVRDVFAAPVRLGVPAAGLRGLVDRVTFTACAVPVGLALYGARQVAFGGGFGAGGRSSPAVEKVLGPVKRWLQDFF